MVTCHGCGQRVRDRDARWKMPGWQPGGPQTTVPYCAACYAPWWEQYASVTSLPYRRFIAREQSATEILQYQSLLVPGLLQTPEYASQVLRAAAPAHAEPLLELRLRRQRLLEAPSCPKMSVIMDESVLHRGPPEILRAQLDKLTAVCSAAPVSVRILPSMLLTIDCPFVIIEPYGYVFTETADGGTDGGDAARYRWLFRERWDMSLPFTGQ